MAPFTADLTTEIGDACAPVNGQFGSVTAQQIWNNGAASSNCAAGAPESVPPMAPAGPALATWQNSGQQDVYWRGTDGNLWEDVWSGGTWWASPGHLSVGPMGSEPAVVTNPARNEEDVFWEGMDSQLYEAYYSNSKANWFFVSPVKPLMGPLGSEPAVAAWPAGGQAGQQDVFWKGTNGQLWEASWSNGTWTQPHEPFSSGTLGSAPAVVVNPCGRSRKLSTPDHES